MSGWEWPPPDGDKCGATAEELGSGRQIACCLRKGHRDQMHYWEKIVGDQLLSATWIATGPHTFIGKPAP